MSANLEAKKVLVEEIKNKITELENDKTTNNENRLGAIALKNVLMIVPTIIFSIKNMAKQFLAQLL